MLVAHTGCRRTVLSVTKSLSSPKEAADHLVEHRTRLDEFAASPRRDRPWAADALRLYAPLARRLSDVDIALRLENQAFDVLYPQFAAALRSEIASRVGDPEARVQGVRFFLEGVLRGGNVDVVSLSGRVKSPYSLWRKLTCRQEVMSGIMDFVAFRMVVPDGADCESLMAMVGRAPNVVSVPGRFRDYIRNPKGNGYRSVHNVFVHPDAGMFELQIRTVSMDEQSKAGSAAHWLYKARSHPAPVAA